MKFGTRTIVGFLATVFLAVGVSTIAWAADANTTPGSLISMVPSPSASSGIVTGVAIDSVGNQYYSRQADNEVVVYAPGTVGTAAPMRSISVPNPNLITIGSDNKLYVASSGRVSIFSLTGTLLAEITGAATNIQYALDVDVDGAGNIYVTDYISDSILIFAPGSNGNVAPIRTIAGNLTTLEAPYGIQVFSDGSFWLANYLSNSPQGNLDYWPAGSNGNVAPTKTISGPNMGIAHPVDSITNAAGELVISGYTSANDGAVAFFPSVAIGNVAPTTRIVGGNTHLSRAMGLDEDSCGGLFVANYYQEVAVFGTPCLGSQGGSSGSGSSSGSSANSSTLAETGSTVSPLWFIGGASLIVGLVLALATLRRRTR